MTAMTLLGNASGGSGLCCSYLAPSLSSYLSFPGSTLYNSTLHSYWSQQESALNPSCVLTPSSAQNVSSAITILSSHAAQCQIAIKGGGHSPFAGFANTEVQTGITVDMSSLNSVSLGQVPGIVTVGAGAHWLEVYQYLDALGLAVAGGRNGAVGVGGLTLGGGISHFASRRGFTCDDVVGYEVVLPNGTLVHASANEHRSLFRALKGGSSNYGIVTQFEFSTFEQGQVLAGSLIHSVAEIDAVLKAFTDVASAEEFDANTSLVTGLIYNSTSKAWIVSNGVVYTQPVTNPPVFREILAIPALKNTVKIQNYSTFADEGAGLDPKFNWLFSTGTYTSSYTLMQKFFIELNSTLSAFDIPGGITWSMAFEPLPTKITEHGAGAQGNVLGLDPYEGNAFVVLISPLWPTASPSTERLVEDTTRALTRRLAAIASEMGLLRRWRYLNYAGADQDPIASYGPVNVAFLTAVRAAYDPLGLWRKMVRGGFKI